MKCPTAELLNDAVEMAREYGATELILFGSALDPTAKPRDLDLACRGVRGWDLFGLGAALEEKLRMPVDIVPLDSPTRFGRWIEAHGRRLL
jgi:predicted nucleotidyltransferase